MTIAQLTRRTRWRRWWTGLAAATVAAAWAVAVGAPASAATVDTGSWYVLVNRHSGKALDVYNLATNDGARITQWTRNDGAWQQWQFVDSGGGFYRLRSRHSGKVLDVYNFSTADRAAIVQWADHNGTNQQFRLADSDSGHIRLVNRNSGKAVDVLDLSTADGAQVGQYTDVGGANQQWRLVEVDGGTPPGSYPNPGPVTGDIAVHDPTIVRRPGGGYLMAHTGTDISLKTSTDRIAFRNAGAAFPGGTSWAGAYTNGGRSLWAPDLSIHNGLYYLYSASTFGSNRSAIFLATSPTGASGSWTHRGLVIESRGAIEAPYMFKRGAYYYLYVSFDYCCQGANSNYRVMVGRSTSPTGPFLDRNGVPMASGGGTQIPAGHGAVNGPGHQAVLADTDGDVLIYHYYADNGASLLGINRLGYDAAGWPYVY